MGTNSEVFTVQFVPTEAPKAHIIYLPPFGEEMNRCRAVAARQAKIFAEAGFLCTLIDYQGTGESRGSLEDATIAGWIDDVDTVISSEASRDLPLVLWGCRLGALIALHAAERFELSACICWQPVFNGKMYLTQFLRQRAAALIAQGLPGENTGAIREQIMAGEPIEVAGYPLAAGLVTEIDALNFDSLENIQGLKVYWLENVPQTDAPVSPRVQKDFDKLQAKVAGVSLIPFEGNPIWQLHERADCPQLNAATPVELA